MYLCVSVCVGVHPSRALDRHARRPFGHALGHAPKGIPRRGHCGRRPPGGAGGGGGEGVPPIKTLSVCYAGRVEGHLIQQSTGPWLAHRSRYDERRRRGRACFGGYLIVAFVPFRCLERQRRSSDGDDDIDIATVAEGSKSEEIDLHACMVKNK